MSLAPSTPVASTQLAVPDIARPSVDFPPGILLEDVFLKYDPESLEISDDVKQQAQILKKAVEKMFQSSINQSITQKLNFIGLLQCLGISYHFQQEINHTLKQIYNTFTKENIIGEVGDLHSHALLFRLLRQKGYQISSGIFNRFKNEQGNFNETLTSDIQGLCSLYEASHLRTHGDDIMEEACDFSSTQLKSLANQLSASLVAQINHCLRQPINKSVPRFEAKYHISIYEQDSSYNESLLAFAKIDFNILQNLHLKEICNISKWWKNSNFEKKVPYARYRLLESYLWSLAMSDKPEYNIGRMFVGKLIGVVCLLDDTYDAYGTVQELELFTEAIQRWNIKPIESLPHCMQEVFNAIVELCDEIESTTTESGKSSFVVPHFKQAVFNQVKGYMVEAKWCHEGYIPTYDEYKINGILTSCFPLFITSFVGLGEFATEDVLNWISSDPTIIKVVSVIGRVLDDMASHKFEQQRVHVASAVECCMKQYGISQAEAYCFIHNDVEECWKIINEECIKLNDIPKSVIECIVNLARMSEVSYENHQDKYTNSELLKDYIYSLFLDPMHVPQPTPAGEDI
ncbi:probable terpene synthase 2 isoform X1 [Cajanus cajan]|uniref:probable terpene synthase 2 isoform X1 n=1 Tax=Cajanus cajan TaxID=3821 RepID=UPI0010FB01D4|nr:probable terpene synthase 2 isoform X1 [Cajanus cajan]